VGLQLRDAIFFQQLAAFRDDVTEMLLEKVAARQVELEAELEKLSQYGKAARKSPAAAPVAKTRKPVEKNNDVNSGEIERPVAEAA